MIMRSLLIGAAILCAAPAYAQDKPSVGKYLAEGYEVIRSDFGSACLHHPQERQDAGLVLRPGSERRNVELPYHKVI